MIILRRNYHRISDTLKLLYFVFLRRIVCAIALLLTLCVCLLNCASGALFPGLFRVDIEQGNIVEEKNFNQLQIDMTKTQVQYLLGTPIINDRFHPNRWDYIYLNHLANGGVIHHKLTLLFSDDRLIKIDRVTEDPAQ